MKKILALILVIVMIASCFAGCGKKETITVGYAKKKPFNYTEEGMVVGFDAELAKAAFGALGYSVSFKEYDESELLSELANGTIDCIWNGFNNLSASGELLESLGLTIVQSHAYIENKKENLKYTVAFVQGTEIIDKLDSQLKKLAEDGTTAQLAEKYGLADKKLTVVTDYSDLGIARGSTHVIVGYNKSLCAPLSYKDEDMNLIGFDTELARAVFEGIGYTVTFKDIDMNTKYTNLDSDKVNCIWSGFVYGGVDADGVERTEKVAYSYKYLQQRQVVVVKKDSGIKSVADLADKIGCAFAGSAGEEYLLSLNCATAYGLDAELGCTSEQACLDSLNYDYYGCDFAVVDELVAEAYCSDEMNPDMMILDGSAYATGYYAIGFKKITNKANDPDSLVNKVNAQLEVLAADGTIAKLAEKYGLSDAVVTNFADQKQ